MGTVTLLLGDLEGSTARWEASPAEMTEALSNYDRLLERVLAENQGARPRDQGEGDSFLAGFAHASDAISCAISLQAQIAEQGLTQIRLRLAIHTGDVQLRDKQNYAGPAVNRCARLRALAHGGQTLVSQSTYQLVADRPPMDSGFKDLGTHRLRDLGRPEHVYQLLHPRLPADFPPLSSPESVPNNLETQLTSFVGRRQELERILKLLQTARLVTLTGMGGVGKTRLAAEAASSSLERFADGVWWVDLASVQDPGVVPEVVAQAIRLPGGGGGSTSMGSPNAASGSPVDELANALGEMRILVVLDNCEYLRATCAELAHRLLKECPNLKLVATSIQPLGVDGERVVLIPPMGTSGATSSGGSTDIAEATQLFLERARQHESDTVFTDEDIEAIDAICRRVDALPLAIELAAAHIRMLTPVQILERLDDRFGFLTRGATTTADRHRTLKNTIDWGFGLLTQLEQKLLTRLAIFSGGFTLESAQGVCAFGEIQADQVYELLSSLVDKSCVVRRLRAGRARYYLLETIRQYGIDHLPAAAPTAESTDRKLRLVREGDYWRVGPVDSSILLRDSKGLRYIASLVSRPGHDVFVLDLLDVSEGASAQESAARRAVGDAGEMLDTTALRAYRERILEIEGELEEARGFNETERVTLLEDESRQLSEEISSALGIGGRIRSAASAPERARVSVTKAIRTAIRKIGDEDDWLGKHLDRSIRTGIRCIYVPDTPAVWQVQP
ncbi:MAG TPA: adenylate/guanylate cyclase domain-containing protein [Actinomycetota bacterium]|nr:adenylate/guanylate cyclase domain-containing protein [Actinomycetota bacterium]